MAGLEPLRGVVFEEPEEGSVSGEAWRDDAALRGTANFEIEEVREDGLPTVGFEALRDMALDECNEEGSGSGEDRRGEVALLGAMSFETLCRVMPGFDELRFMLFWGSLGG